MINKLPSNLYEGNAVVGNALPYVQYAEKREQLRQAKDDALDKYYGNLPSTINDKGLRDQEVEPLHQKQNQIQQYWMQNKEKIRKGNTPEAFNYSKMFRDAQGLVQESKNRSATSGKIAQLRANPKYDYIFKDPALIDKIQAHDAPVGADGSQAIDFNQITLPPPPFDASKHMAGIKNIKPNSEPPTYTDIPGDKFNRLETTNKKFAPDDLNAIHIYSQSQLDNNPSFERQIKDHIEKDPAMVAQLSDTFKKHYGHPITNEGDLATAYTLSLSDITPTQKTVRNLDAITSAKNKQQLLMNGLRFGQAKDLIALRHKYKDVSADEKVKDVDAFIDGEVVEAQNSSDDPIGNRGKVMKVSPNILEAFTQKDASTGHTFTPTGVHALYNGNFELVGAAPDGTNVEITRPEYRAALVNHVFNSPTKINQIHTDKTIPTGKTTTVHTGYTRDELKKGGWKDDQIDKAVKAGKIKLD